MRVLGGSAASSASVGNGRYRRTTATPTRSPRAAQLVDGLLRRAGPGAHQHDHSLGVGRSVVVDEVVLPAGQRRRADPSTPARRRALQRRTGCTPRGPGRTRRGSARCRAAPGDRGRARGRGGRRRRPDRSSPQGRRRRGPRSCRSRDWCGSRRRSAGTGRACRASSAWATAAKSAALLDAARAQHREPGRARRHHVAVVAEDAERVRGDRCAPRRGSPSGSARRRS